MIIGVDEVGRGAWAGPLCVGAVALGDYEIIGLTDSKKLTAKKREALSIAIRQHASGIGLGWVSAAQIDKIGLSRALEIATLQAITAINPATDVQIIIDGTQNFLHDTRYAGQVNTLKQADLLVPSVSAASIVAKIARDHYMVLLEQAFSGYAFDKHVGYGTAAHSQALEIHGTTAVHRHSFAPIRVFDGQAPKVSTSDSTPTMGQVAETVAGDYLHQAGFIICERNWKTKWCEIDIVAEKGKTLYFVEVKYRERDTHGDGLAAITPKKQRQMKFAAELWLQNHRQIDYQSAVLSAMSLAGQPPIVTAWLPQI